MLRAAGAAVSGLSEQPVKLSRGLRSRKAQGADVRNAVPLGVGIAATGSIDQISSEAVGRNEARPFSEENQSEPGAEEFAEVVLKSDASAAHEA